MNFIVPLMAVGAAAGAIPLIIHLFNRSRYRRIRWGAMHLLDPVVRQNRRRVRIEQWILLLVRMAIPVALALFMAKPVLTGWRALPGDVKSSVALLVDDSYSMEAGGGEQSNFARARQGARRIVSALRTGSDVSLVPMAGDIGSTMFGPTVDTGKVQQTLDRMKSGFGLARVAASLEAGLEGMRGMLHAKRDMVVFSDFQRISWGAADAPDRQRVLSVLDRFPVKPTLTFYRAEQSFKDNFCVETLTFSRMIIGVGQKVQVKAALKNHGGTAWRGLRVRFSVDGRDEAMAEISLDPGEQGHVMFSCAFKTAGSHFVTVSADADPLKADNSLSAALAVWDRVPAVLVCGERSDEPLMSETDYLEAALQPFAAANVPLADLMEPVVIAPEGLTPQSIQAARLVVLANVARLSPGQVRILEDFVGSGGGLMIFPGGLCDTDWYNDRLLKSGKGLLPAAMTLTNDPEAAAATDIAPQHYDHEALAMFNLPENGVLSAGEVRRWFKLEPSAMHGNPAASDGAAAQVLTLAALLTGDPFLVEKPFGQGRVMVCAIPCDADWTDLPMKPSFLPLMQQLATYLASSAYPPRNVAVGQPLMVFTPLSTRGKTLHVQCPDGAVRDMAVAEKGVRCVGEFLDTAAPGLYSVTGDAGFGPIHFVVNTSRAESILDALTEDEIKLLAEDMGADVVADHAGYEALEAQRRHGREIWPWFFWAAIGLMVTELWLGQLFGGIRRRRGGRRP